MLSMKVGASITVIRLLLMYHAINEGTRITVIRLLLMYHAINVGRGYHHCDKAGVDVSCYQ